MTDGETNEGDTPGKEGDTSIENLSELNKLKAHNDEIEKELVRGRELKAESQKLEAEKMLGGNTGGQTEQPKEETAEEYVDKVMAGEIPNGK